VDDAVLAASLVREAGLLAARMLADGLTVEHKTSISDVVSAADRAAEKLISDRLRADRPDDAIVGEEGTSESGTNAADGSVRTWYVDPVDGTYNFLSGLPIWCAAVALDDRLGAVYHPAVDELWVGGVDHPTELNGVAVEPLTDKPLADISIATYLHPSTTLHDDTLRRPLVRTIQGAATVRMMGSGSIELASIATGRLGASLQSNSLPWDWLPGAALVRGAGGRAETVDVDGQRWHVAGNRQAVAEIIALLQQG
jgi:myo-inositol-1(or 4)-monophosphatase